LPTKVNKRWAVYLVLLEKSGSRPKIYIGSGTESLRVSLHAFTTMTKLKTCPDMSRRL
jgi:hypothetical protein